MRDGVKRTVKTSQDKKDIKKQLKMKIKPEKRKVPENLYVEILHDQNYYS